MSRVLSYEEKDTWIHRLSGVTKLLFFLLWSITSMISYDTRVLLVMLVCSLIIFAMSKLSLIHISEPTRQAEISYAVFCLKKKKKKD